MREPLIAFQEECDQVLHDYWTKGIAVNLRHEASALTNALVPSPELKVIFEEVVENAIDRHMEPHIKTLQAIYTSLQNTATSLQGAIVLDDPIEL